jgi:arylsulfatase A-like enzyme
MVKTLLVSIDDVSIEAIVNANTPNIDAFATAPGNKDYSDSFVAGTNCSNFRAKVETGMHAPRPENRTGSIYTRMSPSSLPIGDHLLARLVVASGRTTSQIGKWHLCHPDNLIHRAVAGYLHFRGSQSNLGGDGGDYFGWTAVDDGELMDVDVYATDWTADEAVKELSLGVEFVACAFNATHKPLHVPPGMEQATTRAMLEYLDGALERVLAAAAANDYLVILCSDNGGTAEGGGKNNLMHETLATTLVVGSAPGLFPMSRNVVDSTDLHASVLHAVTGAPPAIGDGRSLFEPLPAAHVAFADLFAGVGEGRPGPDWQEMATDGTVKVIRKPADGEIIVTGWYDEPTGEGHEHLIEALDARGCA